MAGVGFMVGRRQGKKNASSQAGILAAERASRDPW